MRADASRSVAQAMSRWRPPLYFPQMIRFFALLLALLLPIQFAWSAASVYCEHEPVEPRSSHFGHHVHVHQGDAKKATTPKLAPDTDCASCHATSAPVITSTTDSSALVCSALFTKRLVKSAFASATSRTPDRPQWRRLV